MAHADKSSQIFELHASEDSKSTELGAYSFVDLVGKP
jgi:hypothetical protein